MYHPISAPYKCAYKDLVHEWQCNLSLMTIICTEEKEKENKYYKHTFGMWSSSCERVSEAAAPSDPTLRWSRSILPARWGGAQGGTRWWYQNDHYACKSFIKENTGCQRMYTYNLKHKLWIYYAPQKRGENIYRDNRYYPKFPELYSPRINSLIITALKYLTDHWNKLPFWFLLGEFWCISLFPNPFPLFDQLFFIYR